MSVGCFFSARQHIKTFLYVSIFFSWSHNIPSCEVVHHGLFCGHLRLFPPSFCGCGRGLAGAGAGAELPPEGEHCPPECPESTACDLTLALVPPTQKNASWLVSRQQMRG